MTLLLTRRFLPLFITQFLGAFNDNLFKNAFVMLITYRIAVETHSNPQLLITIIAGLFILPYFLFSATAGRLADTIERTKLIRVIKIVEIVLMVTACAGFLTHHTFFLMIVTFCMGTHSTFFGPLKYALLPQHLRKDELLQGNAYIEAGTFLAILLGTILGGLLILHDSGEKLISFGVVFFAVMGYLSCRFIPAAPAPEKYAPVSWNIFTETKNLIQLSFKNKTAYRCIMAISWFWFIGATYLSQFPAYAKDTLHADETVVTLLLTMFSIGIGIGSMVCNTILKGRTSLRPVPWAAFGISVFTLDLFAASHGFAPSAGDTLMNATLFIQQWETMRILIDLLMIAVCGGIYIVPLYTKLQEASDTHLVARMIAANNVINALFMVGSAFFIMAMIAMKLTMPMVFLIVGVANIFVALMVRPFSRN